MTDTTYSYGPAQQTTLQSQVSAGTYQAVSDALAGIHDPTVTSVSNNQFVSSHSNLVVIDNPTQGTTVDATPTYTATGAIVVPGNTATFVDNTSGGNQVVLAQGPTFVELGTATPGGIGSENADYTVLGGDASTFVVDDSHNMGNVLLEASSGRSWMIGGNGPGTTVMYGSTSTTGSAAMTAESGPTTIFAGLGADTAYGGGNTVIHGGGTLNGVADTVAGAGDNQLLLGGYSPTAADTIYAGTGSNQTLAVAQGNNFLYAADTVLGTQGGTGDNLIAGSGNDFLSSIGSTHATTFTTNAGNTTIAGGAATDSVFVNADSGATESIDGGGGSNFVTFVGHSAADVSAASTYNATTGSGTIVFGSGPTEQVANLNHVQTISFSNH